MKHRKGKIVVTIQTFQRTRIRSGQRANIGPGKRYAAETATPTTDDPAGKPNYDESESGSLVCSESHLTKYEPGD